ncbi:MAG: Ppx/GppA phosphatase family protein [Deferrisomatales bacterium]|nr:Ppx/GppA phosphatase family protein [Deferrisomatales bacterium]
MPRPEGRPPAARLAAIDVGTNTIRSIVAQEKDGGGFRVLDDEKETVRLGEGLAETGAICPAAWARAQIALLRMAKIIAGFGVDTVEAVATSAVRKASNGTAFVAAMAADTGIRIRVISGEEEAELAALSARHHFETTDTRHLLVDIGGGSAEVVAALGEHLEQVVSLELGAVYLTERFVRADPIGEAALGALRQHIRRELKRHLDRDFGPQYLIGSGGTFTTLGNVVMLQRGESYDAVHGYEVLHSEVVHVLAMLQRRDSRGRRAIPGVSPERADILLAGVAVVDCLMRHYGVNLLKINGRGIREGLILRSLSKHGLTDAETRPRDWRTTAREFARACHVDEVHADQVTLLGLALFDALAPACELAPRDRELLEAACLLHDVGYFIGYAKHHKHSYHLIRHANLFDFTPREKEIVASVARYHRGAAPKKKHDHFAKLAVADRVLVRRLAALLRLADGLDRRRNRHVRSLDCTLEAGALRVRLHGEGDLSVELHGGESRGELFAAVFGRELVLEATAGNGSRNG